MKPFRFERVLWRHDPWRIVFTPRRRLELVYYRPLNRKFRAPLKLLRPWRAVEDIILQLWNAWEEYLTDHNE